MVQGCHKHKASIRGSTKAVIREVHLEQSAATDRVKVVLSLFLKEEMPVPQKQFVGKVLGFENSTNFVEKYSCNIFTMRTLCFSTNLLFTLVLQTVFARVKTIPFQMT